jgi:hypothetical protein
VIVTDVGCRGVAYTSDFTTVVPTMRPSTDRGRDVAREQHGTGQFSVCTHHPTVRLSLETSTNARISN